MRRLLAVVALLGCSSTGPSRDNRAPEPGDYSVQYTVLMEWLYGEYREVTVEFGLRITMADADTVVAEGIDGWARPGVAVDRGFWNISEYTVAVEQTAGETFLRIGPHASYCTARLWYSFERSYDGYECTITRRDPP